MRGSLWRLDRKGKRWRRGRIESMESTLSSVSLSEMNSLSKKNKRKPYRKRNKTAQSWWPYTEARCTYTWQVTVRQVNRLLPSLSLPLVKKKTPLWRTSLSSQLFIQTRSSSLPFLFSAVPWQKKERRRKRKEKDWEKSLTEDQATK